MGLMPSIKMFRDLLPNGNDVNAEANRLRGIMDTHDNVNIFISEGADIETVYEQEAAGETVPEYF